ncbi:unnamed protein product [Lathyrus sativus]|nr:unnamed protein product [Lathyrus sativus]
MNEARVWNCKSSTFCLSDREFKNPALSLEKSLSSGAKIVKPPEPDDDDTSCELSWLINCVVLRRRIRTENLFAFWRMLIMSMVGPFGMRGDGAPVGVVGTSGTVFSPGDGAVAVVTGKGGDIVVDGNGGDDVVVVGG